MSIENKVAVVTGASRGIGQAMAEGLAEAGADIIGVSHSLAANSKTENKINMALKFINQFKLQS